MPDSIRIKVLSDDDFDGLGYTETRGANVSGSLGFADTFNNRIFVRNTGINELNKYLISHEVEHLFELEGTDDDPDIPGIRHKSFGSFLKALIPGQLFIQAGSKAKEAGKAQGQAEQQQREFTQAVSPQPQAQQQINQPVQEQSRISDLAKTAINVSQSGSATSPLNLFGSGQSAASSQVPESATGFSGLSGGLGNLSLTQQDLEKQKGQYSGRLTF